MDQAVTQSPAADGPCILVEEDGGVVVLTLNRPASGNAIDVAMAQALQAAADQLHAAGTARCVLLRARGSLFSGGGDIKAFAAVSAQGSAHASDYMAELISTFHRALLRLLAYDAPLVVAVHGAAAGAGMSLVLGADFSYLAARAKLLPAYAGIGMSGDGGMTWLLPRLCGLRKAAEILVMNAPIDAGEAAALGLVTGVLPDEGEAFQEAVLAQARRIAAGPRGAIGAIRQLLRDGMSNDLQAQLALEEDAMTRLAGGPDLPEGIAAMREKRPPVFG